MKFTIFTIFLVMSFVLKPSASANDKKLLEKINSQYAHLTQSINCKSITSPQLKNLYDKQSKFIIIDTRAKNEQEVSILPNAISKDFFLKNKDKYRDQKIIVYCTIGYRSGKFAEKHKEFNMLNLKGGVLSWSHIGGKFMQEGKETKKVHTYHKDWNFLHSKYEAVTK